MGDPTESHYAPPPSPNLCGAIPQFSTNASLMLRVNKDDGILYKGPEIRGGSGHGPLTQCALRVEANVFNENVLLFFFPPRRHHSGYQHLQDMDNLHFTLV